MPSTVDSVSEFQVNSDKRRCWDFFTNLQNIGGCIPGCESVTLVDDRSAIFKVRFSVGYVSRTFELKARFRDVTPDSMISFEAAGGDADVSGTVTLSTGSQPGVTTIGYKFQIRPVSVIGRTAVAMLGSDLPKRQAEAFADCVKAKLEGART